MTAQRNVLRETMLWWEIVTRGSQTILAWDENSFSRGNPSIEAIRQSSNLFAYSMNNPTMWVDPSGLEPFTMLKKVGKWIGGLFSGCGAATVTAPNFVVNNANTFVSWMMVFESSKQIMNLAQVQGLLVKANNYGVAVSLNAGHAGTAWSMPHLHFGNARVHVAITQEAFDWLLQFLIP